jgi:hypothetical protein
MALLGRIMPMQVEKTEKEVDVYKTVEEVKQALRDRGLPVERIYPMLQFEPAGRRRGARMQCRKCVPERRLPIAFEA